VSGRRVRTNHTCAGVVRMNHYQSRLKIGSSNGRPHDESEPRRKERRRTLRAKTPNQQLYMDAIDRCDVVICMGPAGSGKSHVAAGMASRYLLDGEVERIVGVRPALETGRSLGFLPGDIDDKIHPYLKPLLAELSEFVGTDEVRKMRSGELPTIELSALSYLRGSNFKDSFVVLDEAQNATFAEMWMFLTRLSHGSKMVINGDVTQSDLPESERGAMEYFAAMFGMLDEFGIVRMTRDDIVRHDLVRKMMDIRERYGAEGL
jgi:phosphate starvation-inducible protein PhoH and related proteins